MILALAAFWPLVTSHCKLEPIADFEFLFCGQSEKSAPRGDDDCDNDGCAIIESGLYKTEERLVTASPPLIAVVGSPAPTSEVQPLSLRSASAASSPPEIHKSWQFSQRAASPPRAPSFTS